MDEEILQDFLVEAGELVENLDGQLADLANSPTDKELLNAIFRGFHTVKGGAGFLGVTPLIEVCHLAENVFDKIRNGEVNYDDNAADIIVSAFDAVSDYLEALREGEREFDSPDPELLASLNILWKGGVVEEIQPTQEDPLLDSASTTELSLESGVDPDGDMTDDEFEALLSQRDSPSPKNEQTGLELAEGVDPDGDMTDEEFEALLSQREGEATDVDSNDLAVKPESTPTPAPVPKPKPASKPMEKTSKPKAMAESTVRVDTKRLDEIMNLVGELVLVRNRLLTLKGSGTEQEELATAVGNLDHVTTDLQASVMKTRMQPVKKVFGRFPRVVRDLSKNLGKEIELQLEGEDTDLDKNLVEALADPLVHLVRNSVDHGVEMPDIREAAGKPRKGIVVLAAKQEGDHILLSITDDGKGMDPDVLRKKAVEKGMMDELAASQLDDSAAFQLIMAAGFSTAEVVSDISGRGVGMDVVKTMITKLNGSVEINSELGKGSQINIRVPLTLAILPTLMVSFGIDSYAIPLTSVQEIFDYDSSQTNEIDGKIMVRLREKSIPLLFLADWLAPDIDSTELSDYKVIMVSIGNQRAGLVVQQVNGQEEVVIKPLGVMMKNIDGYAGATITGNGSVALILDLPGVIQRFQYL